MRLRKLEKSFGPGIKLEIIDNNLIAIRYRRHIHIVRRFTPDNQQKDAETIIKEVQKAVTVVKNKANFDEQWISMLKEWK